MKKIVYILSILLLAPMSGALAEEQGSNTASISSGASQPAQPTTNTSAKAGSSTDAIDASKNFLINLKDSGSSPTAELAARVQVVSDALSLAIKEVAGLKADLSKISGIKDKSIEAKLLAQYSTQLDSYLSYYNSKQDELKKLSDIDSVKALAKEIIDFRSGDYAAEIEKIADFNLLFYTNDAINTAAARSTKIAVDIANLDKLGIIKSNDFKAKLDAASSAIKDASTNYAKAQSLALSLPTTKTKSDTNNDNATAQTPAAPVVNLTTRNHLESSLTNVKTAYDAFLTISKDIRKRLGLTTK